MRFHNSAADREPQANPTAARSLRSAKEFLEHARLGPGWKARPTIGDLDEHVAIIRARRDVDRTGSWSVFENIVEQVRDDLLHRGGIDIQQRKIDRDAHLHFTIPQPPIE